MFFLFEALGKLRWFTDSSILAGMLAAWHGELAPGSISAHYLERVAIPGVAIFARLVPSANSRAGWRSSSDSGRRLSPSSPFFMALNFQIASGAVFRCASVERLRLPRVLRLDGRPMFEGSRLPWSVR